MRKINQIVIHTSDTPKGRDVTAEEIRMWHVEERGWSDIGYHFVIRLDGTIELGRMINVIGAHVAGFNSGSIGICYVGGYKGEDTRTDEQKKSLIFLLNTLRLMFKDAEILGHRDFIGVTKKCPNFNVIPEYEMI